MGPLFPLAGNTVVKSFGAIRYGHNFCWVYNRRSKKVWPKMHVHCWRSYAITEMARAGIPEEVRRRVVGHVVQTVHEGYNAVDINRLKEAVEAIP